MTPHLDAANILACTKAGFAYFEEMFDSAYPFTKYDQVFAPEYNWGAMENAGCVTINETYIFRGKVPETHVERRALTILHELAHLWLATGHGMMGVGMSAGTGQLLADMVAQRRPAVDPSAFDPARFA